MDTFVIKSIIEIIKARPNDIHAVITTKSGITTNAFSIETYLGNIVFNNEFTEHIKMSCKDIKYIGIAENFKV